ncbi:Crp/Fnr family transcriptional regulator [Clostridium uliginosum]|uniref:cAMP-binding domain of CRP or a regulatory subunit of cAMP-dependent protein kinases n=1 Tax=Clostridium uliginosum TaxID=119641 RepID=A0A1I1HV71_9CLOT|nr:Crp/Fnr family transcriptional regulator [Clostridium uliginosum]SFC28049.1 cAMP-binding domain of CRP or a regulatory subunit of cAMP-dependent protein kinases [Clostridium uliginosum]
MEDVINKLKENQFFNGLESQDIRNVISNIRYSLKCYEKGEVIASEEEECNSLGIILDGIVEIQKIYSSGKCIVLKRLANNDVFGEALVFSNKSTYPSTVMAFNNCKIIYIKKEDIIKLCLKEEKILENFMALLSNKVLMLNSKIKNISFKSVKHKVINFILEQMKEQESEVINLKESKEEISSILGIPRPSLSRELMSLRDMNYIEFNRNTIKILNIEQLEEELFD